MLVFAEYDEVIEAKPGEEVVLLCPGSNHRRPLIIFWSNSSKDLALIINHKHDSTHRVFDSRAEIKDKDKYGDYSLALRNVTFEDTGIYRCGAHYEDQFIDWTVFLNVTNEGEHFEKDDIV